MKELRIKDICDKGSSNLRQKDVEGKDGLYPVYGASGIISHIDTYHQEDNYIAIVKDGSGIGRVTFMPAKSSVIGTMQYILPKKGFDINYIGYCLQSLDLSKYKQGAAIPHIYFRDYGERIVNVTEDINEQQSIVAYLDSAFAKIDAMKANAEKVLNEAQALFQASLKEMLEPKEGWEEKKLGEILNLRRGHDLTHSQMKGSDYPVAGSNGQIGTHNCCTPISPCITVGRSGTVGAVNIYNECWAHNTTLYIDDFKGNYPNYLYYLLLSIDLAHLNSGSAVPTLNRNFIHPLVVPFVKDDNKQQSIVATLDSLKSKVDKLQANYDKISQECDALKQSILRQVFE